MSSQYKDNEQTKRQIEMQDDIDDLIFNMLVERQIKMQDTIDNVIFNVLVEIHQIYSAASKERLPEFSWDIGKISNVRKEIEKQLNLPEIY